MRAKIWKTVEKIYVFGILVYFAAAGIRALTMPSFSDWARYMSSHAIYACAWPIALPIEMVLWRPSGSQSRGQLP